MLISIFSFNSHLTNRYKRKVLKLFLPCALSVGNKIQWIPVDMATG
jgi:hypothetical protein